MTKSRRVPRLLLGLVAVVLVAAVVFAVTSDGGSGDTNGAEPAAGRGSTATVAQGELTSQVFQNGTLGYEAQPDGSPYTVVNQASGLYTTLPNAGDVVKCGSVVYRVDDEPVFLLCGRIAAYRSLYEGMSGPDVRILNRNLVDLGYATSEEIDPESKYFGYATVEALEQLQSDLGLEETGSLELGEAVVLPGPLRLTAVSVSAGTPAQPASPLGTGTSTRRQVEVDLEAAQGSTVEVGDHAQVTLPDNSSTPGVVSRIGTVSAAAEGSESEAGPESGSAGATIPIFVRLKRPHDVGKLGEAPVKVQITTGRDKNALSVPVTALVARAGKGYAVEVVDSDGERHLVPVTLGMFDQAGGTVAIKSPKIKAGQQVVVPGS